MPKPTKIVCVGRNYRAHALEMGHELPAEPLIFLKPPSAVVDNGASIVLPNGVGRVDFEGEIGLVIGTQARSVSSGDGWSHVAGIVPLNDVTARDLQKSDAQWTRAKGFDTFCPVGNMKPIEEVDLGSLGVETRVNGVLRQSGIISDMAFPIPFLLSYISHVMTLEPGDIIATGTPEGVGPLQSGDEVVVSVLGVGDVRNLVEEGPP